jgi:phosphoglycolate phosphatase-like HAD superfamily hydrolase
LFETFQKNGKDLLEIVTSRIACTKGSSEKFQIIDTVQILEPLQQVSQSWQPQCEIPDDVRSHDIFKAINKTRQQVDELLEKAIQEKRDRLLDVYDSLVAELGENFKKKEVIEEVKEALDKASEAGVLGSKNRNKIDAAIDSFDKAPIVKFMEDMKRIKAENKSGKLLPELSQDYQKATKAATEFIKVVNDCLDKSLRRAENEINNLSSTEGATLESIDPAILEGFATLKNLVTEIKG